MASIEQRTGKDGRPVYRVKVSSFPAHKVGSMPTEHLTQHLVHLAVIIEKAVSTFERFRHRMRWECLQNIPVPC